MIVALIITAVLLSILSGFAKAVCDLSEEGELINKRKHKTDYH